MNEKISEEKIIGIDIGSSAIKIALFEIKSDKLSVIKVVFHEIIGLELDEKAYVEIINDLLIKNNIISKSVIFVLNGQQCQTKIMTLPKMNNELIEKTVLSELKKESNINTDEYYCFIKNFREYDLKLEDGINQKKIEVLVSYVNKKIIEKYLNIANRLNLTCKQIIPLSVCLFSFAKKSNLLNDLNNDEVIMFLDFGNSQMSVNFIDKSGLKFSKDINMGGNVLTLAHKAMHPGETLSLKESEERKFKLGILSQKAIDELNDTMPNANLHKVLNLSFKKLFQRIRLSVGYYLANYRDSTLSSRVIKKIYLFGGNSEIPGIISYFDDAFEADIIKVDSWSICDNSECNMSICEKYNLSFLSVVALACEYFNPTYNVNFLTLNQLTNDVNKFDDKNDLKNLKINNLNNFDNIRQYFNYNFKKIFFSLFILYFSLFILITIYDVLNVVTTNINLNKLKIEVNKFNSNDNIEFKKKCEVLYEEYSQKKVANEIITFKKYTISDILVLLSNVINENIKIIRFNFNSESVPMIIFNGLANDYKGIIELSENLKKSNLFSNVNLKRSEQKNLEIEFQLECELKVN